MSHSYRAVSLTQVIEINVFSLKHAKTMTITFVELMSMLFGRNIEEQYQ